MTTPMTSQSLPSLHFIGIGGIGMSAIAQLFVDNGNTVSGSDQKLDSSIIETLRSRGATILEQGSQASKDAIKNADFVVVSTAVKDDHPEYVYALEEGVEILHRSEALAKIAQEDIFIAIAGTHGKTTTSSMAAVTLWENGLDPSFAIGGVIDIFNSNARRSEKTQGYFIAEADESDASFLNYNVDIAVITNVEADHLDFYGSEEKVFAAFEQFLCQLDSGASVIVCTDDSGVQKLLLHNMSQLDETKPLSYIGYGTEDLEQIDPEIVKKLKRYYHLDKNSLQSSEGLVIEQYDVGSGQKLQSFPVFNVGLPGLYNALNATAVLAISQIVGIDPRGATKAISSFSGVARRFELKGQVNNISVFDDYAHHPTEVQATLRGAVQVKGENKMHVIFQPHLYSRTEEFAQEFAESLDQADRVLVLDIYRAREDFREDVDRTRVTQFMSNAVEKLEDFDVDLISADPQAAIVSFIETVEPGDLIMTMGAGDVTQYGPQILDHLRTSSRHFTESEENHGA